MEPATGATNLKDSPSMATFVFALLEAAARTSVNRVALETSFDTPFLITIDVPSAASPNAVIASVTMSLVVARLSPDAPARYITASRAFSIS